MCFLEPTFSLASDMREGAAKLAALHRDAPDSRHIDAHQRVFGA
jgi:hypothetical protein